MIEQQSLDAMRGSKMGAMGDIARAAFKWLHAHTRGLSSVSVLPSNYPPTSF
jgi:hypothetical protein